MTAFRHEALMYAGEEEFVDAATRFVRAGVEAGEPALVVVGADRIEALRAALAGAADGVRFADMAEVGLNPARIIPLWREFVAEHAGGGRRIRGVGEPIWPGRGPEELVECHRHEALLNVAFAGDADFWLLCPYDTAALDPAVIAEAGRTHPHLVQDGRRRASGDYVGGEPPAPPLPEPPGTPDELAFHARSLDAVRRFVGWRAADAGLPPQRVEAAILAASELATNSVRHGGGEGVLRMWRDPDGLVCEVRDGGRIDDPLAGRRRPGAGEGGGYGLWLITQLCELVQIRRNVVRVTIKAAPAPAAVAGTRS